MHLLGGYLGKHHFWCPWDMDGLTHQHHHYSRCALQSRNMTWPIYEGQQSPSWGEDGPACECMHACSVVHVCSHACICICAPTAQRLPPCLSARVNKSINLIVLYNNLTTCWGDSIYTTYHLRSFVLFPLKEGFWGQRRLSSIGMFNLVDELEGFLLERHLSNH